MARNEKEWLIIVENKHIMGPISLKLLKDLILNKLLKPMDQVCKGNGDWFFIRDREKVFGHIFKNK